MTKKLLYVVNFADFFLSHRRPLALAAREAGYDVHVAVPESAKDGQIRALGFTLHSFPLSRKGMNPFRELGSLMALRKLYQELKPDLLHHLTIKPMLYGSLASRTLKHAGIVNAVTGMGYLFSGQGLVPRVFSRLVSIAYRHAFKRPLIRVIFQNPDDRDYFLRKRIIDAERAVVIKGSGVNLDEFSPRPEPPGDPLVVLASRMLWSKGVEEFVQAAATLRKRGIRARFALVGAPDPGNPLSIPEARLKAWSDQGAVEWWGHRHDMTEVLGQASIVCLPALHREGVPRVLIEAAAAGKPIVTTNEPGCREIVENGKNGFLVPSKDVEALAGSLKRLVDDPALRAEMGRKGRALVEREFSEEIVIQRTLEVYRDLMRSN